MCLTTFVKVSDILLCVLDSMCSRCFQKCTDSLFSHTPIDKRGWAGFEIENRKWERSTRQQLRQHITEKDKDTIRTWDMTKYLYNSVSLLQWRIILKQLVMGLGQGS